MLVAHVLVAAGHVEERLAGFAAVKAAYDLYRDDFGWKSPPYEYEYERNPFDVISGTTELRAQIERGDSLKSIVESWQPALGEFKRVRQEHLLY